MKQLKQRYIRKNLVSANTKMEVFRKLQNIYGLCLEKHARFLSLKGLSHEIDFKNFDKKLHNLV